MNVLGDSGILGDVLYSASPTSARSQSVGRTIFRINQIVALECLIRLVQSFGTLQVVRYRWGMAVVPGEIEQTNRSHGVRRKTVWVGWHFNGGNFRLGAVAWTSTRLC